MAVNFFDAHHTQSASGRFGLFDDRPELKLSAEIKETDIEACQGIVDNTGGHNVDFYGLDNSLVLYKPAPLEREQESICDGLLQTNNAIAFVELKDREYSGWLGKATTQLINTTKLFAAHHDLNAYDSACAYVCNRMRPSATLNHNLQIERYRNETAHLNFKGGLLLEMDVKREITV